MFCPNCGNNVPDDAAFCGKCGNRFAQRVASQPSVSQPVTMGATAPTPVQNSVSVSTGSSVASIGFSVFQLVTVVVVIVAIVFAFQPWFSPSSTLKNIGSVGNTIGQIGSALTGKDYNLPTFKDSYSVTEFTSLSKDVATYVSYKSQIQSLYNSSSSSSSKSSSDSGRAKAVSITDPQYGGDSGAAFLILSQYLFYAWVVGVILLILGAAIFLSKVKHYKVLLILGALVMLCVGFVWYYVSLQLASGDYAADPATNALICGLLCVVAIILAIVTRRGKASASSTA